MTDVNTRETVLVGDAGGTNVRFGLAVLSDDRISLTDFKKMPGDDFTCFEDALVKYIDDTGISLRGKRTVFALAGPPQNGVVALTNRDWRVSESDLIQKFGFSAAHLVNDFTAMARGIPELSENDLTEIKPGAAMQGAPIIVAGPGTGLGVATLVPHQDGRYTVIGGEGGFMAFAPQTEIERAVHAILSRDHAYIYNELLCAGIGFTRLLAALHEVYDRPYATLDPQQVLERAQAGDALCQELCRIRARVTLSTAGDLVLANGGRGGAVLAGGVSEHLIDYLTEPEALHRFTNRAKNTAYLETCPIHLLQRADAPLLGAAALALRP